MLCNVTNNLDYFHFVQWMFDYTLGDITPSELSCIKESSTPVQMLRPDISDYLDMVVPGHRAMKD